MPRTRSLETYPNREFWALVQRILSQPDPFIVPCTRPQAASVRGELYAWRRACEAAPLQAAQYGIDSQQLREVAFRVKDEGLEGISASLLQNASLILSALGDIGAAPKSASQQALDNLRAMGLGEGNGS